jgi:hypothetical protein
MDIGTLPSPARRALILESARAAMISLLNFSTTSAGVFLPAPGRRLLLAWVQRHLHLTPVLAGQHYFADLEEIREPP